MFAAGWDENALHDAIAVCRQFAFMNRLVFGHGIAADESKFAERGAARMRQGYVARHPGLGRAATSDAAQNKPAE